MTEVSITALGDEPPAVVPTGDETAVEVGTAGVYVGGLDATGQAEGHVPTAQGDDTWEWEAQTGAVSHESIDIAADATLPATHPVLTVRATADATVDVEDAPDGTVVTVHVAEGWEHITWAAGITVTGATDTTETWVVLVRAEGAWQALVSGEPEPTSTPDTGVVDVNDLVDDTDWYRSWGFSEVRRVGAMVYLSLDLYTRASWQLGTNSIIMTLPSGFRPSSTAIGQLHKPDSGGSITLRLFSGSSAGVVEAQRGSVPISNGGNVTAYVVYMTDDPWPA